MTTLVLGGLGLAVLHALLPNHWVPVVLVGRREGWGKVALSRAAALVATAHVASSVLVGILVGTLGLGLAQLSEPLLRGLAGGVLVGMGAWVWWTHGRCEGHGCSAAVEDAPGEAPGGRLLWGLALAMFLSPCLELDAFYLEAARHGWPGIATLSLIYLFVTVPLITLLVTAGDRLRRRLEGRLHGLEHQWGRWAGGLLVALGLLSLFVEI